MDVLPVHFRTFQIFGLWYEDPSRYRPLKLLYRLLVLLVIFQFTFSQSIAIFSIRYSVEQFAEGLFVLLTFVANFYKMMNFIARRESVNLVLDTFRTDICRPQSSGEEAILTKYENMARRAYAVRMGITVTCGLTAFVAPIISARRIDLPFKAYLLDVSSPLQFFVAYLLQIIPVISAVIIDVCFDSTPCACIILTCGQLDLCYHRINSGCTDADEARVDRYVRHHVLIRNLVAQVQAAFISIILPVFCSGLITLCTSIYKLVQVNF